MVRFVMPGAPTCTFAKERLGIMAIVSKSVRNIVGHHAIWFWLEAMKIPYLGPPRG
jgi:hypothetical protein